ncbi:MAG: hypothetical protein ACKOI2_09405 [Actinomycetota bacterium]
MWITSTRRVMSAASCRCPRSPRCKAARSPSTSWVCTRVSTDISITTRRHRRSSPNPKSPTSASGRKIRVTKVPFSATPKALINNDSRGVVKIISDPATGVVLGGSIVGRHAAELISVIALAVTANLKVSDIVESLLVHPALAEALAEAAE